MAVRRLVWVCLGAALLCGGCGGTTESRVKTTAGDPQLAPADSMVEAGLPPQIDDVTDGYTAVQLLRDTPLYETPGKRVRAGAVDDRSRFLRNRMWLPVLDRQRSGFERVPAPWVAGHQTVWLRGKGLEHRRNRYIVVVSVDRRRMWVLEGGKVAFAQDITVGDGSIRGRTHSG